MINFYKNINISHKIELKPNNFQKTYFKKASEISRFAWNWALENWNEKYKNGEKPSGMSLKKEFNSLKKELFHLLMKLQNMLHNNHF
jgi:putative transposase